MGVILDSSVLITVERQGENVRQILTKLSLAGMGDEVVSMSVVSLMELAHGIYRADTPDRYRRRSLFMKELQDALLVIPITESVALRAALIDADAKKQGNTIALADLLIGATALDLGYMVMTSNVRHFKMIPGLRVVLLQ